MAKPRKNAKPHHRPAGKNPRAHERRRHNRPRRNPFAGDTMGNNAKLVLGATGGLLGEELIPKWLLALLNQPDAGLWSYVLAALAVILPAWIFDKVNWKMIAKGWLAGGGAAIVWRAIDDVTSTQAVTVTTGVGSFLTNQQVALPGPNLFSQFTRTQRALPAPGSPASLSTPVSKSGMGYIKYPYAA